MARPYKYGPGLCSGCGVELTVENSCSSVVKQGHGCCNLCNRIRKSAAYRNSNKTKDYNSRWIKVNPEKYKSYYKNWRDGLSPQENSERLRKLMSYYRKVTYGVSQEEFDAKLIVQSGRCEICNQPMLNACQDHNHISGKARDLLCDKCNKMLGQANDNTEILMSAVRYLQKHAGSSLT